MTEWGFTHRTQSEPCGLRPALATMMVALFFVLSPPADADPQSFRQRGQSDGLWYWDLPATPNGLRPLISYSGAGSAPGGTIYVGGMDHVSNSALYRLPGAGSTSALPAPTLSYLGDARAASEAAGNYLTGEGIEKFHTRPTWYGGRVFVANLNDSTQSAAYLNKRGFHWYAFDESAGKFEDMSASEPGGVGAPHGGIVSIVVDAGRGVIYGSELPTGNLYAYDIARRTTQLLGRPAYGRPYVYANRAMWLDRRGRVYLTAGNEGSDHGAPYARTIFNHVHYYDPDTGQFGQRTGWKLQSQHAIDAAQCFQTPRVCYLADNLGTVYRFMDPDPATGKMSWKRIGGVGQTTVATYGNNWVFHVDAKQTRSYLLTRRGKLFEMDLNSGAILRKIDFYVAEPGFKTWYAYGHDAWDAHGRFYFTAFKSLSTSTGVRLVAMDPQRFLAAASGATSNER